MGLWADAKNIRDKDPAARNVAEVIILYPGFHVLVTHKIAHFLYCHKCSSWRASSASWPAT